MVNKKFGAGKRKPRVNKDKVISDIIELRVKKGFSSVSIVKYLIENHSIKKSQAYNYIKMAREQMGEIYNEINKDALKDSILIMENMLEKAMGAGENKLALDIIKELNKVNQLYIEKVDITSGGEALKNITFEIINKKKDDDIDEDKGD